MSDEQQGPSALELWGDVRMLVEQLAADAHKNLEKKNVAAGVRLRHGLREMRKAASALIKLTTAADKAATAARKAAPKEE